MDANPSALPYDTQAGGYDEQGFYLYDDMEEA